MSVKIITYNVQCNHSGEVVPVVQDLAQKHPDSLICLQEVTDDIGRKIAGVLPVSVQRDENMIIAPFGTDLICPESLSFGRTTRTFLKVDVQSSHPVSVLTGKLRHGLAPRERYTVLRDILRYAAETPTLLALDTNCILPWEFRIMFSLLRDSGFDHTRHAEGTHDKRRMEHNWGKYIPSGLARGELDKILFSPHFRLERSAVLSEMTASDHEPVMAHVKMKN